MESQTEAADACISSEVVSYFVGYDVVARCQNYGARLREMEASRLC